jgi:hypothetical protein
MVLKLIKAKTIAALGTVTPGSTTLQYLFNPMIHHDLTENPTSIISNSSNKQGEFSLMKVIIASFILFPYLGPKHFFDTLLPHSDKLTEELLNDTTDLKSFEEPIVATLVPNFFVVYYGNKIPHGDITTDKLKAKVIKHGTGYNLLARVVTKMLSTNKLDEFLMVAVEAKKDQLLICKLFLPSCDPLTSTQLASNNGTCGTIMSIQFNDYPHAMQIIEFFFLPNPPAQAFTQPLATPGTFTFQLPGQLDKESKAKKKITKLMLLHVCVEINFKELTISNMTFATLSNGMEVVPSHPQASCPTSLANLIDHTLLMTTEQDHLSIWSKYLSIQMVGETLAAHMLSENFATDRVTTLNNKANSIDPLASLPQRSACMVEQMHMRDMITNTEKSMDVLNAHKSKAKTSITQNGTMVSVVDFSSLCINLDSIIIVITTADSPPPILHQIYDKVHEDHQQHRVGTMV